MLPSFSCAISFLVQVSYFLSDVQLKVEKAQHLQARNTDNKSVNMHLFLATAAWLFAISATASNSSSDCTTFISTQAGCCPPASSSTVYTPVDCHGCSLATTTTGIHCMMVCHPSTPNRPLFSTNKPHSSAPQTQ